MEKQLDDLNISRYLQDQDTSGRGRCKDCSRLVQWTREHVADHLRASCSVASADRTRNFTKVSASTFNDSTSEHTKESYEGTCRLCVKTFEEGSERIRITKGILTKIRDLQINVNILKTMITMKIFKLFYNFSSLTPSFIRASSVDCVTAISRSSLPSVTTFYCNNRR